MVWNICFILSIVILVITVLLAGIVFTKYKSGRILTPFYTLFAGVFLAVFVGLLPVFVIKVVDETAFVLKVVLFDIMQTFQVFTIDMVGDLILEDIIGSATAISGVYSAYMACLFFFAQILTFGFIISLFKNALANLVYRIHYWGDLYIFSELNEQSLVLAKSIKDRHHDSKIVFTNVDREEGGILSEHIETAKELKAIIFRKDIVTVDFMKHTPKAQINFFTIGEKESDNLILGLKLLDKYNHRANTRLYVFSAGSEGELLLANAPKGEMKVRRVNEVRALIYKYLFDEGERLFTSAIPCEDGQKAINAVVVGLGKNGTEMLKALTWYTQMDGYSVNIHAFDQDELAEDKFAALCPEVMSEKYNGVSIPGESAYTIRIHSGVDVRTKTFADHIAALSDTTFVFVSLGSDTDNISQSANIRMLTARAGCSPIITTVVYSDEEKEALSGITNYRGQEYGIEAIGGLESTYSDDLLIGSELEQLALDRHLKWGQEEEFWQYEYNYRSSMVSAIHMKARIACGIPGADKKEDELTIEERDIIETLEHRRWNAYMRSEGYVYSGSSDSSSRNDLAKMHHDLVDFASLTEAEKRKDSSVGTK